MIVNETMARRLFGPGSPLGRRVVDAAADSPLWMEVVGIVGDVQSIDIAREPAPYQLYMPTTQDPRRGCTLAVRLAGSPPGAALPAIRAALAELDPGLAVQRASAAQDTMVDVTSSMALITRLLVGFAGLGLLLAAVGIYGSLARMVSQRTNEIGLRMALGAQAADVVALVLRSGARVVAFGGAIGLLGAAGLSRVLASTLPGMDTHPVAAGVMAIATFAAVALPRLLSPGAPRHASRSDPRAQERMS